MDNEVVKNFSRISPTAKLVAYLRSFSDIPFAKEMATEANAQLTYTETMGSNAEVPYRLVAVVEARFKAMSEAIRRMQVKNVVEVAAGLCTRGMTMTLDPSVTYVECDLPGIIQEKGSAVQKILRQTGSTRPNLYFESADALQAGSLAVSARAAVRSVPNSPLGICHEGLLSYLSLEEKFEVAKNFHQVLSEHSGYWITSDLSIRLEKERGDQRELLRKKADELTGRNLQVNSFRTTNEVNSFIKDAHFKVVDCWSWKELAGEIVTMPPLDNGGDGVLKELITSTIQVLKAV